MLRVAPSTSLRAGPERRFPTPPSKAGRSSEFTPKPWRRRTGQIKIFHPVRWEKTSKDFRRSAGGTEDLLPEGVSSGMTFGGNEGRYYPGRYIFQPDDNSRQFQGFRLPLTPAIEMVFP